MQTGRRTEWRRRPWLSWLALACSLLLTLLAWNVSRGSIRTRLQDQFVLRTEQIALNILRRMEEHESVLRGCVALFLASDDVTREEFREYFSHLELAQYYPGLLGVGFAKMVRPGELEPTIEQVRREGFPNFEVLPRGARELYTPIVYIEPFTGRNLRAFGFDMYSEEKRREAMQQAWRSGRPVASRIVTLIQDKAQENQPGFLLYLPISRAGSRVPENDQQRLSSLIGFIYSPVRVGDLMRGLLGHGPSDIDYAITEAQGKAPFFDTRGVAAGEGEAALTRQRALFVAGRSWSLRYWSRPNFGNWISRWEPYGVLVAGLVINLLLLSILGASASLQRRAEALARERTEQLSLSHAREQEQMRSSLKEKETLLKEIHHRVKNNLQVVSSLLSLQRSYTQDERALGPLRQSQQRVLTMAALHEFLYQSKDLSRVDTKAYLTHLVSILAETYQPTRKVELVLSLDDVALDVDHAIPCGLITNELVSNAFKYAFADDRGGKLMVGFHQSAGKIALSVEDDGPGLSQGAIEEEPTTLGLSLVQLLTQQLGGLLELSQQRGAKFVVTFPLESRAST
jgi:two-component sensor histidine kinase/CHASE1-domain containing sensor protein